MTYKIFRPITTTNPLLKSKIDYLNHQKIPFRLINDEFLHFHHSDNDLIDITQFSVEKLNKLVQNKDF